MQLVDDVSDRLEGMAKQVTNHGVTETLTASHLKEMNADVRRSAVRARRRPRHHVILWCWREARIAAGNQDNNLPAWVDDDRFAFDLHV